MSAWHVRAEAQHSAAAEVVAQAHSNRDVRIHCTQDVVRDYQPRRLFGAFERRVARGDGTPVLLKSFGGSDPRPSQIC